MHEAPLYDGPDMNKKQRFLAAVRGEPVDRLPSVAWCNFATDSVDAAENARRQLAFQIACDWDICKVMNDYRLAPPAGIETIETPKTFLGSGMSVKHLHVRTRNTVGPVKIKKHELRLGPL